MSKTSPIVCFGTYDPLARKNDTELLDANDNIYFLTQVEDLQHHNLAVPYASLENDRWILDGTMKLLPDDHNEVHIGFVSRRQTSSDGTFAVYSDIIIHQTGSVLTTDGIVIYLDPLDYPTALAVYPRNAAGTLLDTINVYPVGESSIRVPFNVSYQATVHTIEIDLLSTQPAEHFARILDIDVVLATYFTGTEVKQAYLVEQIDMLSVDLPFNTLDLTLFSTDNDFNIVDPLVDYSILKYRQPIFVYEVVDATQSFIGTFYLEKWSNLSETTIQIHAVDIIGVLDKMTYNGHCFFYNDSSNLGLFLQNILLGPIGIAWSADASIYSTVMRGWLPICSYREALRQVAFACSGYVTCSRTGIVEVHAIELGSDLSTTFDHILTNADLGSRSLELTPMVTGVEVTSYDYWYSGISKQYFNQTLPIGTFTITFTSVVNRASYTVTGATVVTFDSNYCVITVATPGVVTITIEELLPSSRIKTITNGSVPVGTQPNVVKITGCTMVGTLLLDTVAQKVYDYYQQRYLQKMKLYAYDAKVGDSILAATVKDYQIKAIIEKMETNLSHGMVEKVEAYGVIA